MSNPRFEGKVVLITGGSSGIGLETARRFVAEGAEVVLVGRDGAALEAARLEVGPRALAVSADVARVADVERVMSEVAQRHGQLDVLLANAGISECPPIRETDAAFFDHPG
jgi:NAD(P)-dependent dehydrogenase (short-subunit alcohol dehydrogenase family)